MNDSSRLINKLVTNSIFSDADRPRQSYNNPRPRRDLRLKQQGTCKIPTCSERPTGKQGLCRACDALGLEANYIMYRMFLDEGMSRQQAMDMAELKTFD